MNIELTVPTLLGLVFNDSEELTAARSEIARYDVYCLAEAVVVSERTARLILTTDPEELHTHVQVVETSVGNVYLLWRKETWMISHSRRYEIAMNRAREKRARDTTVARAERITAMARKLAEAMSGSENDFKSYRAHIADMYDKAGRNEARFAATIADVVEKITRVDFYIPLSAEVLAIIAADEAQQNAETKQENEQRETKEEIRSGTDEVRQPPEEAQGSGREGECAGIEETQGGGSVRGEDGEEVRREASEHVDCA